MSMLGEVFGLVDILQDFPLDLPRGLCYVPTADLQRHGLSTEDLLSGSNRRALDELVELQVERACDLLERAAPVVSLVHPSSQPFLQTCVLAIRLLIRTSGEQRTSNFLPWHTAYAEIVFTDVLWPDFGRRHLVEATGEYAQRQRRFGASQKTAVTTA
jgi:hypothetical protein